MSTFTFANNAYTTLAGAITNTAVTLNVQAGGGALFPSPGAGQYFTLTLVDAATGQLNEIMWCTARTGDTFTVVRGQEGTDALAWSAGDRVSNNITAGSLNSFLQSGQITDASLVHYGAATGTNALTVAATPTFGALADGMLFEIVPAADNTGNVTINVNSSGIKSALNRDGTQLAAGTLLANQPVQFMYKGTTYILMTSSAGTSVPQGALVHYGATTGTDTLTSTVTPSISTLTDGMLFELLPANANTGAVTLSPNSLGYYSLKNPDGTDLAAGAIQAGQPFFAMYLSTPSARFVHMSVSGGSSGGPGTGVGQWLQNFITIPLGKAIDDYITIGVATATGAQLIAGNITGLTGMSGVIVYPVNSLATINGLGPLGAYIEGTPTGTWVYKASIPSLGSIIGVDWQVTWVRTS